MKLNHDETFFEKRAERITETGCWIWTHGTDKDGYGRTWNGSEKIMAHRFAYETFVGAIPSGLLVCHRCDVSCCINPTHLFLGTHAQNMEDRGKKIRQARGASIGIARLKEDDIRSILLDERTQREIAEAYGIAPSNVFQIKARKTWRHVL